MKKTLLAAMLACAFSLGTSAAHAQISDNVVRIGVLTDMSGVYSDLGGLGSVTAAKMAVEDFIATKKPSFKVDVVYADHLNKADIGASKVREWYDREGVDMVTDALNSGVALAAGKITAEKNRVIMNVGAATTRLTNEDCNANTVHYAYDTYALATGVAKAAVKQGGDSWFFLTADYAFGQSMEKDASDVVKSAGGKVVGSVRHPLNASDFSSFLLQAQNSKAKIIGLANAGGDTINAVKSAAEFGITKNQTIAPLLLFLNDIHAMGLQSTQGMMLTEGFYWNLNKETRDWSRRYFSRMKRMPNMLHAGVYSAVTHYLNTIAAAGTDEASAVMKRMKTTPINDFYAKNGRIREDGRMVHDMYLMQVKKPAESKEPWDYYNVLATIKGEDAFQPLSASRCSMIKK
ncbi:MAG: ABC transporter substrate-binding protein [Burkholderiales bacterium]|nr:ABC transporter substrate-binding protein [Burkholderiales bacterium]